MKKYELTFIDDDFCPHTCLVTPQIDSYTKNGRLALLLFCEDDYFTTLTVNIPHEQVKRPKDHAFVDVNNNSWAVQFIKKHKLGKPTGKVGKSGFCTYPEYKFNLRKMNRRNEK